MLSSNLFGFWFFLETKFQYGAQLGLELWFLLPQPSECWDYNCVPLRQQY
jgi:hypothetical protein